MSYRILYCFHGRDKAVLLHALTKEDRIADADIARATRPRRRILEDPDRHAHEEADFP